LDIGDDLWRGVGRFREGGAGTGDSDLAVRLGEEGFDVGGLGGDGGEGAFLGGAVGAFGEGGGYGLGYGFGHSCGCDVSLLAIATSLLSFCPR